MNKHKETIQSQLHYLGLKYLQENWDQVLSDAKNQKPSYYRFLTRILEHESFEKMERRRQSRLKRANIPQSLSIETFPFQTQPRLDKQSIMEAYESLSYIHAPQDMLFLGPTGCGKTGLAISYLVHAINNGYNGYFIECSELLETLNRAVADNTTKKTIKKFASYDCLVIDDLGYTQINKQQASLFFDIMKKRHQKKSTLITTQLGYDEWGSFLNDKHMRVALVDRFTVNCLLFNMTDCKSLRSKNVKNITKKK